MLAVKLEEGSNKRRLQARKGMLHLVFAEYHFALIDFSTTSCGSRTGYGEIRLQAPMLFPGILSLALTHCFSCAYDCGASSDGSQNA